MKKLRVVLSIMMAVMVLVSSVYVYSAEATEADSANAGVEEISEVAEVAGETETKTEEIINKETSEDENDNKNNDENSDESMDEVIDENVSDVEKEDENDVDNEINIEENIKSTEKIYKEKLLAIGDIKTASYEIFTPEEGFVGSVHSGTLKDGTKETYVGYMGECVHTETVVFSGVYEKQGKGLEKIGLADDGDEVFGCIKHYLTEEGTNFFTLEIKSGNKSLNLWTTKRREANIEKNEIRFFCTKYIEDNVAYSSNANNNFSIKVRGGVENDELKEVWIEFEDSYVYVGNVACTDVTYEKDVTGIRKSDKDMMFDIFTVEKGSTIGNTPGVPIEYQNMTKEEQQEKHGAYYDEEGQKITMMYYNGEKEGTIYTTELENYFKLNIRENFDDISSNEMTTFEMYVIRIPRYNKESDISHKGFTFKILKVSGNLGERLYMIGSESWYRPTGSYSSIYPNLDNKSTYLGWRDIVGVTDEYIEMISSGEDTGGLIIHYDDVERTGIESVSFEFDGLYETVAFDAIDYEGGFLRFFLPEVFADSWGRKAKELGLTPTESEE